MSETGERLCRELYKMTTRGPAENGCLDKRLGVSDKKSVCQVRAPRPVFPIFWG